jgi:hypothetical protein
VAAKGLAGGEHSDPRLEPYRLVFHTYNAALCNVSAGAEIHFEMIVPDVVFKAMMRKTTSCRLSGDA